MATITLKRAVEFDGKTFSSIDIDEPTVGGIEAYEKAKAEGATELGATVAMLAVDTGWPEGALRKVRASDLATISGAMAPFLAGPANGAIGA
ncbi:phage tail assembly protein [Ancylobacter polymorphus]|uniref:Phage tail assembly protein n=1 Tax=Ancylobacter polymorphus TaxID=223390 RepID=A0ABU0B623_9HYPH|nr:phage tail assembly protein [Ancylobacter polymorphus]MDQ0301273.1 hypothetical protein [Ancylobacter polymorphus]